MSRRRPLAPTALLGLTLVATPADELPTPPRAATMTVATSGAARPDGAIPLLLALALLVRRRRLRGIDALP